GRGEVLQLQRLYDLSNADAGGLQLRRNDLHGELALNLAERLNVRNAGDRAQLARNSRVHEPCELGGRQHGRRDGQRHDWTIGVVELPDDRFLDLGGQVGADAGDRITHVLRRFIEIL